MRTKEFEVADILSITTGILLASRKMEAVYEILNFLFDENFTTIALPHAAKMATPHLKRAFPELAAFARENNIGKRRLTPEEADSLRQKAAEQLGETRVVTAIC